MPDSFIEGQAKVYRGQGATELVIASGGRILVQAGGYIDLTSATNLLRLATGEITSADIATGAIDTSHITAGAITSAEIAAAAVDSSHLAAGAVTSAAIAAGAVDSSHIQSSAVTSAEIGNTAIKSRMLAGNLASGSIDLGAHLFNARELSSAENFASGSTASGYFFGGLLLNETTPAMKMTATDDQAFYLEWASAVVDAIKLPPIVMPNDLTTAGGLSIDLIGKSAGSATVADAKSAFDVRVWINAGATAVGTTSEVGATHADFTSGGATAKTLTIASGSTPPAGRIVNITLVPEAHANRAIRLYGMRMRYTRTN